MTRASCSTHHQSDQLDQRLSRHFIWSTWSRSTSIPTINIYEAKTQLSALVERAAAGEEIVIAKNGVARARLVPLARAAAPRRPANALHISRIADDFDAADPDVARLFAGSGV